MDLDPSLVARCFPRIAWLAGAKDMEDLELPDRKGLELLKLLIFRSFPHEIVSRKLFTRIDTS